MKTEIIEKLSLLITGAFGLVAALAWNTAIQAIFKNMFGDQSSVGAMLSYAIGVTIIAVVLTMWIGKVLEKAKTADLKLFRKKEQAQEAKTS